MILLKTFFYVFRTRLFFYASDHRLCCTYHETLTHTLLLFDICPYLIVPALHLVFKFRPTVTFFDPCYQCDFLQNFSFSYAFNFHHFRLVSVTIFVLFVWFFFCIQHCRPYCMQLVICVFSKELISFHFFDNHS